jgi:hypothetical protein
MPRLELGETEYRIVGDDGAEGRLVGYGETATLDAGELHLSALIDEESKGLLPGGTKCIDTLTGEAIECVEEDVIFEGEDSEPEIEAADESEDDDDLDELDSPDDDSDDEDSDSDDSEDSDDDLEESEMEMEGVAGAD